jgi:hypothetical protein
MEGVTQECIYLMHNGSYGFIEIHDRRVAWKIIQHHVLACVHMKSSKKVYSLHQSVYLCVCVCVCDCVCDCV